MTKSSILYSGQMKLADIISADHELLSVLERLNIKLGFADAKISEVCKRYGLSENLFLMICNIYSFEQYFPDTENLNKTDIPHIISYLRASHKYYTESFFPRLHEKIHAMVKDYDELNRNVLNKFYDSYDTEVTGHFSYEENVVFPYIENMINNSSEKNNGYSIEQFESHHTNIEEKLNDLKNIIIKYLPEENSNLIGFEVINNIFHIERDLTKHTFVENRILIPLVSKLEKDE